MAEKKLFQDKRWIQNPGGVVVGKSKISEESKKWAEELIKQITTANQRSNFTDKDLYIYKNGKLVLNIYDRDVDFKERAKENYQDTPEIKKTKKDNE